MSERKDEARTKTLLETEDVGREPGNDRTELEELQLELERLKEEKQDLYQQVLRKQADFENYRKRVARERSALRDDVLGDFFKKMIPLVDNLERALISSGHPEGEKGLKEGLDMIHQQFLTLLKEEGMEEITCTGEPFDPHFHDAVMVVESPDHPENIVVEELQKGYRMKDRILRCSKVSVSK